MHEWTSIISHVPLLFLELLRSTEHRVPLPFPSPGQFFSSSATYSVLTLLITLQIAGRC